MKKFFSIIALSAMTLSLSSFSASKNKKITYDNSFVYCADYGYRMAAREGAHYGGFDGYGEWSEAFNFYYDSCLDANENIEDAVFL